MGVDWPSLQRTLELARAAGQRARHRARAAGHRPAPALLFVHGWSSNWQIFLLNIAAFMESTACSRSTCRASAPRTCRARRSRSAGYARTVDAVCDALGVERVSVVGNSMGGFIGAELALSFATRVDRLVLVVGGRALDRAAAPRPVARGGARSWRPGRRTRRASSPRSCAGRGCGGRRCSWALRYPERLSAPLAQELVLSFGKPGFVDGLRAMMDYSYRERLPDRDPGPDRVGAQRPARPRRGRVRPTPS